MSSMEGFKRLGATAGGVAVASTLISAGLDPEWTGLHPDSKLEYWLDAVWKTPVLFLAYVILFTGFGWLLDSTRHLGWLRQTCLLLGVGSAFGVVLYFARWLRSSELAEPGSRFVLALFATAPGIFISVFAVPLVVLRLAEWIVEGFRSAPEAPKSGEPSASWEGVGDLPSTTDPTHDSGRR